MEQNEIKENNPRIALFMGYVAGRIHEKYGQIYTHPDKMGEMWAERFQYHSSWDHLMPVVEKIEALRDITIYGELVRNLAVVIKQDYCSVSATNINAMYYQTPYGSTPESKIAAVYEAITHFITLLNNNNTSSI